MVGSVLGFIGDRDRWCLYCGDVAHEVHLQGYLSIAVRMRDVGFPPDLSLTHCSHEHS